MGKKIDVLCVIGVVIMLAGGFFSFAEGHTAPIVLAICGAGLFVGGAILDGK